MRVAAVVTTLFAAYWAGLRFVELGGEANLGPGPYLVAGMFAMLAVGLAARWRGFEMATMLVSAALLASLTLGVAIFFGADKLLAIATCSELRCAYEFWGAIVGSSLTLVASAVAYQRRQTNR